MYHNNYVAAVYAATKKQAIGMVAGKNAGEGWDAKEASLAEFEPLPAGEAVLFFKNGKKLGWIFSKGISDEEAKRKFFGPFVRADCETVRIHPEELTGYRNSNFLHRLPA